jgi:hypothetical protein
MGTNDDRAVAALGESALTGWRGPVSRAVARPVAKRTRFSEEQVRTAIGLLILAYGFYRLVWPSVRALRRAR